MSSKNCDKGRLEMNTKIKEVFDILDYFVVRFLLLALALIGIAAVIAHAIKVSF
jgi:hypothetical protein